MQPDTAHHINLQRWLELAEKPDNSGISDWMRKSQHNPLLTRLFNHSPHLTKLALKTPSIIHGLAHSGAEAVFQDIIKGIALPEKLDNSHKDLKLLLREAKNKAALLIACADITGSWPLDKVTSALTELAECSLRITLDALLLLAHQRGEIDLKDTANPSKGSGIIILGMGKLGGYELNYSSDIDLIVFFERDSLPYKGRHNEQHFMTKLAHDMVQIMQERTAEGYVFRTDLRLRPDPASTPPAINTDAAYYYYESVGQNWERAAMIKARPVAGDMEAGKKFLDGLAPFMWRRNLDFAAINDIHSIKRQMDTLQNRDIQLKGHNVKLGIGGIREIEFYVQIHQLIWGGRERSLRTQTTCVTLDGLCSFGLIDEHKRNTMRDAYVFLRMLEHRLQMVNDEQTHELPQTDAEIENIALFMGYASVAAFEKDFMHHLNAVHGIYASSFKSAEKLGHEGNLVFTGVTHDPETIKTLKNLGYQQAETVSEIIMGWHHGSCRSTRTKRARELLTELMPVILQRLAETANPDAALLRFHDFLKNLPAGVQLFSLFNIHPQLLGLIADILGSAPTLAERLSKSPELLDAVLYDNFYEPLPDKQTLSSQLDGLLKTADDFEEQMDRVRQFRNEKQFQAGVHFLKHMIDATQAGVFLSDLADVSLDHTVNATMAEFISKYGTLPQSKFAVLAMGKLGSREMTFSSDIDLVFIYDAPDETILSDGEKGLAPSVYFNRFSQRLLTSITAIARDGRLYEVDTRLRPSGSKGLLAVSIEALKQYFEEAAWTFEYMAMTKGRPVSGDVQIRSVLEQFVTDTVLHYRNRHKLREHVIDLRERITREFGTKNPWNIKYVAGGLLDVDFIAQYLLLHHAPNLQPPYPGSSPDILRWLASKHVIEQPFADSMLESESFLSQIFHMLRLCTAQEFDEESAPAGLKKLLYESVKMQDFSELKEKLVATQQNVYAHYLSLIQPETKETPI
ncbi:MAG: bifunctional [glutamine synthetase] adenylyltransferase/[glutamine synthetase]-adenylyl-L-tyrosine phosphorylase [Alphaproteobacteria bacterium]